jgi:intein/homing endonuclease
MSTTGDLRYPKKSHRKKVILPRASKKLAEVFGILIGDGGINNPWQANVTLNTVADADYIPFVAKLLRELFTAIPAIRTRKKRSATVVSLASISVVDFLVSKGIRRGNKLKAGLEIPGWILCKKAYKIACVRGLVDTDGCLILHIHTVSGRKYKNLYLSFSSASPKLLEQVASILIELGLSVSFATSKKELLLYGARDVERYLRVIGSSNERIWRVFRKWRDG